MFLLVDAEGKYIRTREREEFREVWARDKKRKKGEGGNNESGKPSK